MTNWLLPENIQDMLPEEAWQIELMRRTILDLFRVHGYQLVAPPLLEYAESLLINNNAEMELRSFKLVDQMSGRTLAVRADITPQVARIDAHLLNRQGVTRLCYAGSVLHTLPSGLMRTREPLQIGAELFGDNTLASDLEIQRLMLQALNLLGIRGIHLDLGHVAVFNALLQGIDLKEKFATALFAALQSKDLSTLKTLVAELPTSVQNALLELPALSGDVAVLQQARRVLPASPELHLALDELAESAQQLHPFAHSIGIDLAELRGYHYHSGMVFAAYHAGSHDAIALGGRYDNLGKSFGRARAATGFSMDLRQLQELLAKYMINKAIIAPAITDVTLDEAIRQLRSAGQIVIVDLLKDRAHWAELNADRKLVLREGQWSVVDINP